MGRERSGQELDPFKEYLNQRLQAGVWNAQVLLRELRGRDDAGGYTILKSWLQPQRQAAQTAAVRRFETPPGKQAQVDRPPGASSPTRRANVAALAVHDDAGS